VKNANRLERRTQAARMRRSERHAKHVTVLSYQLGLSAFMGRRSRKASRRILRDEVLRRYGRNTATLMGARLVSVKEAAEMLTRMTAKRERERERAPSVSPARGDSALSTALLRAT
jgi:hypothetical protein